MVLLYTEHLFQRQILEKIRIKSEDINLIFLS